MPQIDQTGFLGLIWVSVITYFLLFFVFYVFIALPQFSSLRARFDIFKVSFTRLVFVFLEKLNWTLLKVLW